MIILIDNYDSFTYNLYQLCIGFVDEIKVFRNDKITVEEVIAMHPEAIIISPGPKSPNEAGICVELIRQACGTFPILGVCLGMQSIGAAFGAKITHAPIPMHGKTSEIFHNHGILYQNLPQPFIAGRYHSLAIDSKNFPSLLIKEAETADGVIMGIRHRDYPTYGVQFHPESILTNIGGQLMQNFLSQFGNTLNIQFDQCF